MSRWGYSSSRLLRILVAISFVAGPAMIPALRAGAGEDRQPDVRERPHTNGPVTLEKRKCLPLDFPAALNDLCVFYYSIDPTKELDLTKNYGVVWLQALVDPKQKYCVAQVTADIKVGPLGFEARAPEKRVETTRPMQLKTSLHSNLKGQMLLDDVTIERSFTLFPDQLVPSKVVKQGFFDDSPQTRERLTWKGFTSRKLVFVSGAIVSWSVAEEILYEVYGAPPPLYSAAGELSADFDYCSPEGGDREAPDSQMVRSSTTSAAFNVRYPVVSQSQNQSGPEAHRMRVVRRASARYSGPGSAAGVPGIILDDLGGTAFETYRGEHYVDIEIEDDSGQPVFARIGQDTDGDHDMDAWHSVCGKSEEPLKIVPLIDLWVWINAGPCMEPALAPALATHGTITASWYAVSRK